jgi:hypothetical protein
MSENGLGIRVLEFIAMNNRLTKLLALMCDPILDTFTILPDKLIGDWDDAKAGDKITITLLDPYRVEHGVLMALPGIHADDIMRGGIVHVLEKADDPDTQYWMPLKYVAIMAESIELDPKW